MRAAFTEIIDYAGLFPPAACGMRDAIRQYDIYHQSDQRWLLGRFIVPTSRLDEMVRAIDEEGIDLDPVDPWHLSVTLGAVIQPEIEEIGRFNARWGQRGLVVDSVEYKVRSVGDLVGTDDLIPETLLRHYEVPREGPYQPLIAAIANAGAYAKVRTGGTTPGLFPDAHHLADFIIAVVGARLRFKCTAGLHHTFPGIYALTYETNSPRHEMFGFAAILAAVAEAERGGEVSVIERMLGDRDRDAYEWVEGGLRWREHEYDWEALGEAHRLFVGFGSCSFREPVDELGVSVVA
jgi:hypothetical protein